MSPTTATLTAQASQIRLAGTDAPIVTPTETCDDELTPLQAMGHRGVAPPGIPQFDTLAAKRQWQLEHLAGAFRVFGREGYAEGIAGHISVRDPENPDRF